MKCVVVAISLCAILAVNSAIIAAEVAVPANTTFEQRRQMMLDAVWADYQEHADKPSGKDAFWRAEALFELGKITEGRKLVHRGLDQLIPGNKENRWILGGNSGFNAYPGVDSYVRYERFFDDTLKDRYRTIYTGAVFYRRLSTSNHKIMAAVTRYLATQIWGQDAFHPDPFFQGKEDTGAIFEKNDPTGEKYVRAIIADTVKSGPGEYASRPYGAANLLPLLTLAECARNEEIRQRAQLAYEYCLIELAPVWLRGHMATFAPRSYPDMETQQPWGVAALAWAYFGGITPAHLLNQWALRAATATYRLPDTIEAISADRSQPYVHRALISRWALYHFVSPSYILFSRSPKATGGGFMGQSYPCGVMWEEPEVNRGSHLWITNPAADDNTGDASNRTDGIHTHGVSKYEQELQYRDALLFVFNIAADFRNPYVLGFVPGGYRAVRSEPDRIFLHYGNVLIAVTSVHPFGWDPKSGVCAPAGKPHEGDSEFRVKSTQTAVAIETALPSEFPAGSPAEQLNEFRERILARTKIALTPGDKPTGRNTDRNGNALECAFDGPDTINGQVVDYTKWPGLDNPWMKQPQPGGALRITHNGVTRVYDFQNWRITQ